MAFSHARGCFKRRCRAPVSPAVPTHHSHLEKKIEESDRGHRLLKGPEGMYMSLQCPWFQVQIMDALGIPTPLLPKGKSAGKSIMPRIPSPSWSGKQGSSNDEIMTGPAQALVGGSSCLALEPEPHNLCAIKTFKSSTL